MLTILIVLLSSLPSSSFHSPVQVLIARSAHSASPLQSLDSSSSLFTPSLSSLLTNLIAASDDRHNSGKDGASTGWSDWVDPSSSKLLSSHLSSALKINPNAASYAWLTSSPASCLTVRVNLPGLTTYERARAVCTLHFLKSGSTALAASESPPGSISYVSCLKGSLTAARNLKGGRTVGKVALSPGEGPAIR